MRPDAQFYYPCNCGLILEWTLDELLAAGSTVKCPKCGQWYKLAAVEEGKSGE